MQTEISRSKRHHPPAHYSLKFQTYSLLSEAENYKSGVFEAGGYKWRLVLYPNGDKHRNGGKYISLYLEVVETDSFPLCWEVNVKFILFVYDQLEDKYLAIQDANGDVKRFHEMKTTCGFSQLLALETFKDPSNGYLINDSCVFGAEVFVSKYTGCQEAISLIRSAHIINPIFTWRIEKFSQCDEAYFMSDEFTIHDKNWYLKIYPNGEDNLKGKSLALYLMPSNKSGGDRNKAAVYAKFKLRLPNQVDRKRSHDGHSVCYCFPASKSYGYGYSNFISLEDLSRPSNGFLVEDSLIVQVEFVAVSHTKYITQPRLSLPPISSDKKSSKMKVIAAYLLAVSGGNTSPSGTDLKGILSSVGAEADDEKIRLLMAEVEGKDFLTELIACGIREKLASVSSSGGVAAADSAPTSSAGAAGAAPTVAAAAAAAAAAESKEEKVEEREEYGDDDTGLRRLFGLS